MLDCCISIPGPGGEGGGGGACLDDYLTAVDDASFSTNLATPQATGKTLVTPPGFTGGTYQLQFSYAMEPNEFEIFFVQMGLNGAPPGSAVWPQNHEERVTDDDDGEVYVYAQAICVEIPTGVNTLELYLWTDNNDVQTMVETTIELWKVA